MAAPATGSFFRMAANLIIAVLLMLLVPPVVPHNITVHKCCPLDQVLSAGGRCERPITATTTWNLKVFSPSKKMLLTQTDLPANWQVTEAVQPICRRPVTLTAKPANYLSFENGSLFVVEYDRLFDPEHYCIDYKAALICVDQSHDRPEQLSHVRVRKCCGTDGIFSTTNQSCVFIKNQAYSVDVGKDKTLVAGFPQCVNHRVALVGKLHDAVMFDNGTLWIEKHDMKIPSNNYCLEHVLENTGRSPSVMVCQEHLPPSVIVAVEPSNRQSDLRFTLYPIGLAFSAVFLAATLVAGSLLPASHHVLHWRCQTNHVACLLVGDILLCITHLSNRMSPTPCFLIAVFMHFLFLAAFFWLNTMCFNIWWTFRDLRPQSVEKGQERCRLRLYEIYAWGGPLLIAGTAAILDTIPDNDAYTILKPRFGTSKCWFHGNMEIFTFFFGPVGVLLIVNLTLFAATARELTCGLWKRELVKSNTERAALGRVCIKLVVVMGVTWIADLLSWIVGGPQELWYLTDLINSLQGVFIFIVVGCQPQVLASIKRLWCLRKHRENGTASTTNHHSSSSQGIPSLGDTITNNSITNNTTKSIPLETTC